MLSLYYPVFPHYVGRAWGVTDPVYESYGFKRHNGLDIDLEDGQEILAPFEAAVTLVGKEKGGGSYLCLLSTSRYTFEDGMSAQVELTFMHVKDICVSEGMRVRVGERIALGGRTGRTKSTHLHLAPKRVKKGVFGYRDIDRNDADNTFDPAPYWNGVYARTRQQPER